MCRHRVPALRTGLGSQLGRCPGIHAIRISVRAQSRLFATRAASARWSPARRPVVSSLRVAWGVLSERHSYLRDIPRVGWPRTPSISNRLASWVVCGEFGGVVVFLGFGLCMNRPKLDIVDTCLVRYEFGETERQPSRW